jgi:hypothetical protein
MRSFTVLDDVCAAGDGGGVGCDGDGGGGFGCDGDGAIRDAEHAATKSNPAAYGPGLRIIPKADTIRGASKAWHGRARR